MSDSAPSDNDDFDPDSGFVKKDENEEWKDEDKEIMEQVSGRGNYKQVWHVINGRGITASGGGGGPEEESRCSR